MLRNGEQLLLAIVIPVIVLVGGVAAAGRIGLDLDGERAVDILTPGVLALAVMSTAFTSIAIATGFERRYGVIKLLGSSPLPRHGLLLGKILALLNVVALQLVVLVVVGLALGWKPTLAHPPSSLLGLALAVCLGTAAFASLGLFVAGVLRAEATLALANLVYLLLMAGGGVVLPASTYGAASSAIQWLPSGALGEAMRSALVARRRSTAGPCSCWPPGRRSAPCSQPEPSGGNDEHPARPALPVPLAAGGGQPGRQHRHRGDRRCRPSDRIRTRLPDVAALHRCVVRRPRRARPARRHRVRQPDADLRADGRRHRSASWPRSAHGTDARRACPSSSRWASRSRR